MLDYAGGLEGRTSGLEGGGDRGECGLYGVLRVCPQIPSRSGLLGRRSNDGLLNF